jgi:fructosamine-3-kinase
MAFAELRALGLERGVASIGRLPGGYVADVWLVTYAGGRRVVGKTLTGAPADLFQAQAEGLAALGATGHLPTPGVLAVTDRLLLLEALAARDDSESSWDAFAHDLAALHRSTVQEGFGWAHDGYLGRVVQRNPWTASGHEFFAQYWLLRYLDEPLVRQELTRADRGRWSCLIRVVPLLADLPRRGSLGSSFSARRRMGRRAVGHRGPRPSRWCMKWPPRDLFLFKRELPLLSIQPH